MVSGSNIDRLPTLEDGLEGPTGNLNLEDRLRTELEFILRAQPNQQAVDTERDLNIYRSGSAPPTVDGSLSAVGSLFRNPDFGQINNSISSGGIGGSINTGILSEEEIRSHPAYLSYYYSHESINPRLPPPLLSKEDWRVARRFQDGGMSPGGGGDWRKRGIDSGDTSSLFSMQPGLSVQQAENELMELRNASQRNMAKQTSAEWLGKGSDGLIGLNVPGLGSRRKSFADIVQEGLDRPTSSASQLSRPASCNAFGELVDVSGMSTVNLAGLNNGIDNLEVLHSAAARQGMLGLKTHKTASHFLASDVSSSLSRSTTPELQLGGRSSSSSILPVGSRVSPVEKSNAFGLNAHNDPPRMSEIPEMAAKLSGLSLSKLRHADDDKQTQSQPKLNRDNQPNLMYNVPNGHKQSLEQQSIGRSNTKNMSFSPNYSDFTGNKGIVRNRSASMLNSNGQINVPKRTSSLANLRMNTTGVASMDGAGGHHQSANIRAFSGGDGQSLNELHNHVGRNLRSQGVDPRYVQYMGRSSDYAACDVASASDASEVRKFLAASQRDVDGFQKAYIETLLAQQQQQYELQLLGESGDLNHGYYGRHLYGLGMQYTGNLLANPVVPSVGSGCFQNDQSLHFSSMMRSSMGGPGSWQSDAANNMGIKYTSSLLDEFKTNKTRSFELSDIVDHVVEFSTDQHGSRFIQQKLEAATVEEKTKIFPEIIPHARTLMTDVFGNYVIQKFFEHGTESQRTQLAGQLLGHVLRLSLQMYGCRVIQKALEVVNVDQQTQMVAELDGSVMKCVRDQNGNHVIQKCIECVPQDRIQFIISAFYGQVVALSTHPYGCRVIQRVLEHCNDVNTQQTIMDEVMQCVCDLAQDQYGNYVIQHVLEHGKPHERSAIISKLAGQIIRMSQQKFASNVVEKCLTFGSPEERQILVNEMLCSADGNEPLQAMMKDPFGNYVVQKVLETCDDKSLEIILSRIKVHLNTLKKYTYGKHIVSRIEKLVTTGERRIGLSTSVSS